MIQILVASRSAVRPYTPTPSKTLVQGCSPSAGPTSLYAYLRQHPQLYLPAKLHQQLVPKAASYAWKKPPPLDSQSRNAITHNFAEEIDQLQTLLGRDLSHWLA